MAANNVVGTLLPVGELCAIARERGILFHTDAVQAAAHIPLNVRELGVDLLSLSAHKFHGPKGVGALFARLPLNPPPFLCGGGQEKGRRSGTENVAGIVGMAAAIAEETHNLPASAKTLTALRDKLIAAITAIPGAGLTGDPGKRLPGLASFIFDGLEAVFLINALSAEGICASSGSACSASSKEAPHVLAALGYDAVLGRSALRLSLSAYNTEAEVDRLIKILPGLVAEARIDTREKRYPSNLSRNSLVEEDASRRGISC
jgi:cysteine desulfurase